MSTFPTPPTAKPPSNMKLDETLQDLYRTADKTRAEFSNNAERAVAYYGELVKFVSQIQPASRANDLLDVGCGSGWSSFSFARNGYQTTGIDLNSRSFEPPSAHNLTLLEGSALALSFADCMFDIVVAYQCLEHMPDPELALREMTRVCRTGGIICIVGPNLVSPFLPIKALIKECISGQIVLKRKQTTPKHPYGNTAGEHIQSFLKVSAILSRKLLTSQPSFTMRVPDVRPPFVADNDACYLCNPTDIVRYFQNGSFRILRKGKDGRSAVSNLLAGGTWVAAQRL